MNIKKYLFYFYLIQKSYNEMCYEATFTMKEIYWKIKYTKKERGFLFNAMDTALSYRTKFDLKTVKIAG